MISDVDKLISGMGELKTVVTIARSAACKEVAVVFS
jgi:hypothetical protein